jgi:hypothetical protein
MPEGSLSVVPAQNPGWLLPVLVKAGLDFHLKFKRFADPYAVAVLQVRELDFFPADIQARTSP